MSERAIGADVVASATSVRLQRLIAVWPAIGLAAIGAAIFAINVPLLPEHYFVGDDFVPLADIASRSTPDYIRDLFLLNDTTPNWRFLTGLAYLGLYRAFGLDALPYFLTSLLVHIATAGLIYRLVHRVTNAAAPGLLAAAFFGLTPAHAHTIGLVTAFNNVLAAFLMMLSLVLLYEALERRTLGLWYIGSVAAFLGAVAANDSAAVLAPLPVAFVLSKSGDAWREPGEWPRPALLSAPYVLVAASTLIALGACNCTEATRSGVSAWGEHMNGNLWIYLGRLLYPVGLEFPGHVETAHQVAGIVLLLLLVAALVHGPTLARIAVLFLALALVPYVSIRYALAPRYVYMASVPFSILTGLFYMEIARFAQRLVSVAPIALGALAIGVLGLYGWQTLEQNAMLEPASDNWRALVADLRRSDKPAAGSRVYLRGGPITDPGYQFVVMPAVAEVVWGDVELFSVPQNLTSLCERTGANTYVLDYTGDRYAQSAVFGATEGDEPYRWPPPVPPLCSQLVTVP